MFRLIGGAALRPLPLLDYPGIARSCYTRYNLEVVSIEEGNESWARRLFYAYSA